MTDQSNLSRITALAIKEAETSKSSTVRPEHILMALASTESFFASQLKKSGLDKPILAQALTDAHDRKRESFPDKLSCVLHRCIGANVPPISTDFFRVAHWSYRGRVNAPPEVITYDDLCYALLIDSPENSVVHESLRRLGLNPRELKEALQSQRQ